MRIRESFLFWLSGWHDLASYDDVEGYRQLSWGRRKALDHRILWRGIRSEGFWRALFFVGALAVVCLAITWRLDLAGWQRDLLRCCPILTAIPWLAAARKRHLRALIKARGGAKLAD
jgi:hypothetical protein